MEETSSFSGFHFKQTISPKPIKRRALDEENSIEQKDFVLSISGNKLESLKEEEEEEVSNGPLVIPLPNVSLRRISNKYARFLNKEVSASSKDSSIEKECKRNEKDSSNSHEIQEKKKTLDELAVDELMKEARGEKMIEISEEIELPMLIKYRNFDLDHISDETERFRADVESRPNEATHEDYSRVPVSQFGSGLLRGMGWSPGAPIGITNASVVAPVEVSQRPGHRLGLGASIDLPALLQQGKQQGNRPKSKLNSYPLRNPLKEPGHNGAFRIGAQVALISGVHEGLRGTIVAATGDRSMSILSVEDMNDCITVRFDASGEEAKVAKSDVTVLEENHLEHTQSKENNSFPESTTSIQPPLLVESPMPKLEPLDSNLQSKSNGHILSANEKVVSIIEHHPKNSQNDSIISSESNLHCWLFPGLVVRVISKGFSNGKYYLKKGIVMDVFGRKECTIQLSENGKLIEVKQGMLETVIPKIGEQVMVLLDGPHRHKLGTLMSKETGKDNEKRAIVQLKEELSIHSYELDSICHYVGE